MISRFPQILINGGLSDLSPCLMWGCHPQQEVRRANKTEAQKAAAAEKAAKEDSRKAAELRSYSSLMQVWLTQAHPACKEGLQTLLHCGAGSLVLRCQPR